jgi:hypothetical protein
VTISSQLYVVAKGIKSSFDEINIHAIVTPSDEAFALLLLENAWERWIHQAANLEDENFPTTKYNVQE